MTTKMIPLNPELLTALFKSLRKQGFIARQRAACCRTCASYEIATEKDGANHGKFVVYTTAQDYPTRGQGELTEIYLKYGVVNNAERAKIDPITETREEELMLEAATYIIETAKAIGGLEVEWDGTTGTCIMLKAKQPEAEPTFLDLYKQEA
jgi:hypothetical protein